VKTWILATALALAYVQPTRADDLNSAIKAFDKARTVVSRLQGRLIGWQIHKGMTKAEVDRILGKRKPDASGAFLTSACLIEDRIYYDLGFRVSFFSASDEPARVDDFAFFPLIP
jgi:hypothetical protein